MSSNDSAKLPHTLRCQPDPIRAGFHRLVDTKGTVWARDIPSRAAALVLAATPGLHRGYKALLETAHECFRLRWNLRWNDPDFEEFLEDDGELEERFPGAAANAERLKELCDLFSDLLLADGSSPVETYVDPQVDLFLPLQA